MSEPPPVTPRVSVVVPCFNYGAYLPHAVESVAVQAGDDVELVIVDDGSTDDSLAVAEALAARHPALVRVLAQPNSGQPAVARNNGIAATSGEYVLCLDADDEISPNFLTACVRALETNPAASIAYPDQENIGTRTGHEPHPPYDAAMLTRFNFIPPASLFRRSAWSDTGGFATNVAGYEDWDFWLACAEHGHYGVHVPAARWRYRHHGDSLYARQRSKDLELKARVVRNHRRLYGRRQRAWADAVLAGDAGARALAPRLGVVPTFEDDDRPTLPQGQPGKLNLLFTMTGWADEGGGTILPRQIAKALVRRGHRVTVLSAPVQEIEGAPPYHVRAAVDEGVHLLFVHNRPSRFNDPGNPGREIEDPTLVAIARQLADELQPDLVHLHSLLGLSLALPEALGAPTVYTSHNYWPICPRMYLFRDDLSLCSGPEPTGEKCGTCLGRPQLAPQYARRLQAGTRALGRHLAVSQRVKDLFVAAGHDPDGIHVLHQQPETVDWIWERVGAGRTPLERLERPLRVGFIGSLYPHKGAHVLVQAAQLLPGVEVHLFGGGATAYIEQLRAADTAGRVVFHGGYEPSRLPDLLGSVDVVCVPSLWEDCAPLTVAEALAARAPVVGSAIGGIPEFFENGVEGLAVRPRDPQALADGLRRFLDDPGLLGRMQAAIAPPRGFDTYLDELEEHYRQAIAETPARATAAIDGARSVAVLAFADELAGEPTLLEAWAAAVGGGDDVTLVIDGRGTTGPELEALLGPALAAAGLDAEGSADLLAVTEADEALLSQGAVAVLSRRGPRPPFRRLPHFDETGIAGLQTLLQLPGAA